MLGKIKRPQRDPHVPAEMEGYSDVGAADVASHGVARNWGHDRRCPVPDPATGAVIVGGRSDAEIRRALNRAARVMKRDARLMLLRLNILQIRLKLARLVLCVRLQSMRFRDQCVRYARHGGRHP